MRIETDRLVITEFDLSMAEAVHKNSLDDDNRRFVPDEVFETIKDAAKTIDFLIDCYHSDNGPFVYPILLKCGENIGYVQLIPIEDDYEVGYHIAKPFTRNGYATEALKGFLEYIRTEKNLDIVYGICASENIASKIVLEKCGFQKVFEGIGEYQGTERNVAKYVFTLSETRKEKFVN